MVIAFTFQSKGETYSGFFDFRTNTRISPSLEYEWAHNYQREKEFIDSNNLKLVYPLDVDIGGGLSVEGIGMDNNQGCRFPYFTSFVVRKDHEKVSSTTIFVRQPIVEVHEFGCPFEESPPPKPARLKFQSIIPRFYSDGRDGFYMSRGPYLIHFDHSSRSKFFAGRSDIVALSGDRLDEITAEAEGSEAGSWQPYIDRAEKIIEQAIADQGGHSVKP